ncbi:hypothetical protein L6164_013304 [Bauhinia variegata]|uniref:Uncharacterized protein n=1 Tax=Bauhinia variegata TaxID=167791 RepID=A0ACB9PI51_BAUVA|nr:hypothetical protein L6164_013304 [Bauhinia variegata]
MVLALLGQNVNRNELSNDATDDVARAYWQQAETECKELFASFRVFCNRKSIPCKEILVEDMDIPKAITEAISTYSIELLVLGSPSRSGLIRRFRTNDVPSLVSKGAPPFCTVDVISKGKIASVKSATAPLSKPPTQRNQLQPQPTPTPDLMEAPSMLNPPPRAAERLAYGSTRQQSADDEIRSPFTRGSKFKYEPSMLPDSDISYVSSGRPSTDQIFPSLYDHMDTGIPNRLSNGSDSSYDSSFSANKSVDHSSQFGDFSFSSQDSGMSSMRLSTSNNMDDMEGEMRRLKLELKQTMEMYSTACKEALTVKQKASGLQCLKLEEQKRFEEAGETSQRMRKDQKKPSSFDGFSCVRYKRYTIEEIEEATKSFSQSLKIGEGGYRPVYRSELDHTPVAIKTLKADAAQGLSQFQQEVEVLSYIRHPNMVLLLGACPKYGCLVYEFMAHGSLDDRLFRRGNTPVIPWQLRFRIAAEIAIGLLFLHQTKP